MCGPRDELTIGPSPVPIHWYETLLAQYRILRTIGQGSYAEVKLAQHRLTGAEVAIKVLLKRKQQIFRIWSEVGIMKRMNHPNIISLLQIIETEQNIFLILELAEGRELWDWIQEVGHLQENIARKIFKQIVHAMCYCHDRGIVHRDLKPDNIMVDATGKVKIIDFGLGALIRPGRKLFRFCGALQFGAPEFFLRQPYDGTKVDTWNLGVLLYFMVTGTLPFDGSTFKELQCKVLLGLYAVPSHLSQELQDIIHRLLTVNPMERPTLKDVMGHPWLREGDEGSSCPCDEISPSHPDPAIMAAMAEMGFDPRDIRKSVLHRYFNEPMATYGLLQCRARQQGGLIRQTKAVQPGTTPFPMRTDPVAFPGCRKRTTDVSVFQSFLSLSLKTDSAKDSQKVGQRLRSVTVPIIAPRHCLQKRTPACGAVRDPTGTQHSGTADTIQGAWRSCKRWARRIGASLLRAFCCLPSERRVRPQMEVSRKRQEAKG
ncbi:sperm motility kinase 3A-like [Peromyscus californicus insignis]|uniref:sperm motility kinase 3A-like n=1 Tax=Peromyscus californicus insignis TaxID=564181 RepID=UPI0022A74D85|nr:sperm motility kinase 3A-like [Peromyscus californicus insignis]